MNWTMKWTWELGSSKEHGFIFIRFEDGSMTSMRGVNLQLSRIFKEGTYIRIKCPIASCDCWINNDPKKLAMHLNDDHMLSFLEIADYVEMFENFDWTHDFSLSSE